MRVEESILLAGSVYFDLDSYTDRETVDVTIWRDGHIHTQGQIDRSDLDDIIANLTRFRDALNVK